MHLFEDLLSSGLSQKLVSRIQSHKLVLNVSNKAHGVTARRGDGTLGELIPGQAVIGVPNFDVGRGAIATIEIGAECKVLAKAMIKQIDRVMTDMRNQVSQFNKGAGSRPITVAIVGVNHADYAVSYEGPRAHPTRGWIDPDTGQQVAGVRDKNPIDEADEAIRRIRADVEPFYDVTIILRYRARNVSPFVFEWVDSPGMARDYAAALVKISREYDQRF